MLQEIQKNDNGFHNKACGMNFAEFQKWLTKEYAYDCGILEDWMVPQSSYWMIEDDTPIGYGRIRHYLNDNLLENSGHIGYAVRKSQRCKGFGGQLLALLLEECRHLGLSEVQIGANADNIPSNKIIQRSGGTLIRTSNGKNFYRIIL